MILDVVYNHVGPGSEALAAFGPYFTDRHQTFWGDALDYAQRGVREWAIGNALAWTRDYRVDGLRLDATHAIFDDSEPHVLRELRERVDGLVISETEVGDLRPIRVKVDAIYTGPVVRAAAERHAVDVQVSRRNPAARGFAPLPVRWRIEATFGTLTNRYRRLTRNLEQSPEAAENVVETVHCRAVIGVPRNAVVAIPNKGI